MINISVTRYIKNNKTINNIKFNLTKNMHHLNYLKLIISMANNIIIHDIERLVLMFLIILILCTLIIQYMAKLFLYFKQFIYKYYLYVYWFLMYLVTKMFIIYVIYIYILDYVRGCEF
jgi:hypothetical protein